MRTSERVRALACVLVAACGGWMGAPLSAQDVVPPASGADAKASLARAAGLVEAMKGVKGPERLDGMRKAAEAYDQVAQSFASDAPTVARARLRKRRAAPTTPPLYLEPWRTQGRSTAAARSDRVRWRVRKYIPNPAA